MPCMTGLKQWRKLRLQGYSKAEASAIVKGKRRSGRRSKRAAARRSLFGRLFGSL